MILPIFFIVILVLGSIAVFLYVKEDKTQDQLAETKDLETKREDSAHMIVHELRAPLSAIKDSAELMLSNSYSFNKEEERKLLGIIKDQSKLLLDQVGSMLDAAKLEAGKFVLQKKTGNIADLIKERLKAFHPQAQKKQIQLALETKEPLPLFAFDPIRIAQVMNNLLSNSLKFTQDGGKITVKVDYKPTAINYLTISVADTGIGIPKEQQENLFSKFSQPPATPGQIATEGTGLGLYVVKGIVEAHGGTVGLKSNPGDGTTVSFTLPVI